MNEPIRTHMTGGRKHEPVGQSRNAPLGSGFLQSEETEKDERLSVLQRTVALRVDTRPPGKSAGGKAPGGRASMVIMSAFCSVYP
jgi:hypothetical protein